VNLCFVIGPILRVFYSPVNPGRFSWASSLVLSVGPESNSNWISRRGQRHTLQFLGHDLIFVSTKPAAGHVEVLGLDLAVTFLLSFGGSELYLPRAPGEASEIAALIGPENTAGLAAISHRLPRRVPLAKPWLAAVFASRGESASQIARALRVSDVTVRRWLKTGKLV